MKKNLILLLATGTTIASGAGVPVIDVSVLEQTIQVVTLATDTLKQANTLVERQGNPVNIRVAGAGQVLASLGRSGVGRTIDDLRQAASGLNDLRYDGSGLYRAVGEAIKSADGRQFPRAIDEYRKYDAVTLAKNTLEEVLNDTEVRRQAIRLAIKATTAELHAASTFGQIQKAQGILSAQAAELAAIDRERDVALGRILVLQVENQTDQARQAQARHEERVVDFQTATDKTSAWLTPVSAPVRIPDPRLRQP